MAKETKTKVKQEFSAGGVVYKKVSGSVFWLITKSKASVLYPLSYWRLPKGMVDGDKDGKITTSEWVIRKTAIREVAEEGGVKAKISKKIGTNKRFYTFLGKKRLKFITYYLMEFVSDLSQGFGDETSEIGWYNHKQACRMLKYDDEREILTKAVDLI